MSCRNMSAVIYWTDEKLVSIEPAKSVPESARFEGSVTPVKFSGDNRWYPARVLLISGDQSALQKKMEEVERDIAKDKQKEQQRSKGTTGNQPRSRNRNQKHGAASDRQIALALGKRPPVPSELKASKIGTLKEKRTSAKCYATGQQMLDNEASSSVRKSLFNKDTMGSSVDSGCSTDAFINADDDALNRSYESDELSSCDEAETPSDSGCGCEVNKFVQKHCSPTALSLLRDLTFLFENNGNVQQKYLPLLPLSDKVKQVELYHGKGVYIANSDKEVIKVDFKNKPSSLIRETLYCLYGKKAFQTLHVTGRGQKQGSYGIQENVLRALHGFVNHNVDQEKKLKFSDMVASINKRAPEWRKGAPCSTEKRKRIDRAEHQVVSTSLCSTEKKKRRTERAENVSPLTSPVSSPVSSPEKTPGMLSATTLPSDSDNTYWDPSGHLSHQAQQSVQSHQAQQSVQSQQSVHSQQSLPSLHSHQAQQSLPSLHSHQAHEVQQSVCRPNPTSWEEWNMWNKHQNHQYQEYPTYHQL